MPTPPDPQTLALDRLTEQLARERQARTEADFARVLTVRGTDPAAADALSKTVHDHVTEYTAAGVPVIRLASGKTLPGADGLSALATEVRLAASRRAMADPANAQTQRILENKRRTSFYGTF